MSRKIKFSISDKNRLTLLEDASRGDYIDLTDHLEVDVTPIENAIKEAKDQIYNKMLLDFKEKCENSNQLKMLQNEEKFKKEIDFETYKSKQLMEYVAYKNKIGKYEEEEE